MFYHIAEKKIGSCDENTTYSGVVLTNLEEFGNVFDIFSQLKLKLKRKLKNKIYANEDDISKHHHGFDMSSQNLTNY